MLAGLTGSDAAAEAPLNSCRDAATEICRPSGCLAEGYRCQACQGCQCCRIAAGPYGPNNRKLGTV